MFILKQYDNPLIEFEINEDAINGQYCCIKKVYREFQQFLPVGLEVTDEGLMTWLKARIIPKNRAFVENFLTKQGLSRRDTKGIIQVCLGLSLNDSYWIVEDGFKGKFSKYNLYENDFVKALSLIAYTGFGSSRAKGFTSSPEFTTAGMLRKGWRRLKGKIYLYKGGTKGFANAGNEPFSEFMASQIADCMGIEHVEYNLAKWNKELCSTCELFSDINHSFVPIYKIVPQNDLRSVADYLKKLGNKYYERFSDMMVFDALIYNEDRHFGNYGLIIDNKTNKPEAFAPLFDHGLSLFNYAMEDDLRNIDEYRKTRMSSNGVSFDSIAEQFITLRQKKMLRKLVGFKFKRHPSYSIPADRVRAVEKIIQVRVKELLQLEIQN